MNCKKPKGYCRAFGLARRILMLFLCISFTMTFYGQKADANLCNITDLPSVQFRSNSSKLLPSAQGILTSVGNQLKNNPTCKAKVTGYGDASKRGQQLSWDRVNAVIKYLVEEMGISEDRCLFLYGQSGNPNTVDLMPTTEDGPHSVPAPVSQYRNN